MPDQDIRPDDANAPVRFLTFHVAERCYALRAEDIIEVIPVPPSARVPQGPKALIGIANLRGSVLPVASLRGLLDMKDAGVNAFARAIVLDIGSTIAVVVDAVDSLVTLSAQQIETRPVQVGAKQGELLLGAFQSGGEGRIAKILDIKRLLEMAFAERGKSQRKTQHMTTGTAAPPQARQEAAAAERLITFEVAGQEFGLGLDDVQEILPVPETLTTMPRAEALVLGMTAHRESLLPLLSLRGLLGFPLAPDGAMREKVVVMKIAGTHVGLVADRARAIVAADPALVEPVPSILAARVGGESRIKAIYRGESGRRLISILAPEQLFREDVMQQLVAGNRTGAAEFQKDETAQQPELKFLVFRLGEDEFGLPIDAVDEVAQVPAQVTRLPKTPKFLEGVVNLRGDVLPVVDQRRRFDMPKLDADKNRRLVVVKTQRHRAGLIVDSVSDVLRVTAGAVAPAPDLTDEMSRLIKGVINLEKSGRIVLVLDPAELLTRAERGLLDKFQAETTQAGA